MRFIALWRDMMGEKKSKRSILATIILAITEKSHLTLSAYVKSA